MMPWRLAASPPGNGNRLRTFFSGERFAQHAFECLAGCAAGKLLKQDYFLSALELGRHALIDPGTKFFASS